MRNIVEIAEQMIEMIDCDETNRLIARVLDSAAFTAPEAMYLRWKQIHEIILDYLDEDEKKWTDENIEMISIFSGNSIEDIKKTIWGDNTNDAS